MLRWSLLICGMVGIVACQNPVPTSEDMPANMHECPPSPDLAALPAKCAAAKGLAGDVLNDLCLDMDKIDTAGLTSRGFTLAFTPGSCDSWEVAGNKLQPKSATTSGNLDCAISFPNLAVDTKYSRLTLALVHQATLNDATQQARIDLYKTPLPVSIWLWGNGPNPTVDQRTIVEMDVAKLPRTPNAQAIFRLTAPMGSPVPTWTITSIAVLGQTAQ